MVLPKANPIGSTNSLSCSWSFWPLYARVASVRSWRRRCFLKRIRPRMSMPVVEGPQIQARAEAQSDVEDAQALPALAPDLDEGEFLALAAAVADRNVRALVAAFDLAAQVARSLHALAIDGEYHVAFAKSGACARRSRGYAREQHRAVASRCAYTDRLTANPAAMVNPGRRAANRGKQKRKQRQQGLSHADPDPADRYSGSAGGAGAGSEPRRRAPPARAGLGGSPRWRTHQCGWTFCWQPVPSRDQRDGFGGGLTTQLLV